MYAFVVFFLMLTASSSYAELVHSGVSSDEREIHYTDIDSEYASQTSNIRSPKRCNFKRRSPFAVGLTFFNRQTAKVESVPKGLEVFYCHPTRSLKHAFDDYQDRLKPLMAEQCRKVSLKRQSDTVGFVSSSPLSQPENLQVFFLIRCTPEKQNIFVPAIPGTPVKKGDIPYLSNIASAPDKHTILLNDSKLLTFTPKKDSTHLQAADTQMSFRLLNSDFSFDLSQVFNQDPKTLREAGIMFRNQPLAFLRSSDSLKIPKAPKKKYLKKIPSPSFPNNKNSNKPLIEKGGGIVLGVSG